MTSPLKIGGIHLEECRFSHVGEYLGRLPSPSPSDGNALIQVETIHAKEPDRLVVRLRVNSTPDNPDYSFAVSYVVLLQMDGIAKPDLARPIAITGASMLMPYARELLNNLTGRGRFGAVLTLPVNFNDIIPENQPAVPAVPPVRRRRKT